MENYLIQKQNLKQNPLLGSIFLKWYQQFIQELNKQGIKPEDKILEIGSGGGFLKEVLPQVITSDVVKLDWCEMQFSAEKIPFEDQSLSAIFMVNVFHHIPNVNLFLAEAQRTLKPGGFIYMVEPANTLLSRFIYKKFHHEKFDEKVGMWEFDSTDPLFDSNQALAWVVFYRDKHIFAEKFPLLKIDFKYAHTPFKYILSGGHSRKPFLPTFFNASINALEWLSKPVHSVLGLFYCIKISKKVSA